MSATKFTEQNVEALLDLFADGLTISDAGTELDISATTIKGWITRGNKEGEGPYFSFAERVREARLDASEVETPMDEEELKLVTSRSARKGNIQAMRLMWEMLRADGGGEDEEDDPFSELDEDPGDEVGRRRAAKAS